MFSKKLFPLILPFVFWGFAFVSAQTPTPLKLSLADCLQMGAEKNVKLTAIDYEVEGAEWRRSEAQASWKPVIELTNRMAPVPTDAENPLQSFFDGNLTFFNSAKLGVGLPIYSFGKLSTAENLAKKGIEGAREKKEREKGQIRYDIQRLYYGILFGLESKDLLKEALEKINDKLQKEEEKPEHTPYDIAKLKVFKLELEKRLVEAGEKEKMAREALRFQLGLPRDQPFDLADRYLDPKPFQLKPLDDYMETALAQRPDAHLVDVGVKAKALEWELEKRKILPNVGLGTFVEIGKTSGSIENLRATDDFNNPFNYTRAGVGLEIKGQFDIYGSRAKRNRLKSEYHKATTEESLAKEGILLEVKEAYGEVRQFERHLNIAEEKKKLARQMLFLSKSNMEIGVGEEEEYTDALQLLLGSRGEYLKAVFDYNVALAKLEWKTGEGR